MFVIKDKYNLQKKKLKFYLEITVYGPSIFMMENPKFIVSNQKEESISA